MNFRARATTSIAAIAILALSGAPSLAASEAEISQAIKDIVASGGNRSDVNLGTATQTGDTLVYSGVSVSQPPDSNGTVREGKIATLTLTNPDVDANGSLTADSLVAEGVSATSNTGAGLRMERFEVTNLVAPKTNPSAQAPGRYDQVTATNLTATDENAQTVTVDRISLSNSDYVNDFPHKIDLAVEGIDVDLSKATDEGVQQLRALGYETLTFNIFGAGNYNQDGGSIDVSRLSLEGVDLGALTLTGQLGGFTPDVIQMLQQPQPGPEVLTKVNVTSATLTYEDRSLATRVLDQQAQAAGATREAFAENLAAALPLILSSLQNPDFQTEVANAVGAFLKNPQRLSVTVKPETPMSIMEIIGVAQTAPQTLPNVLNADVTANQ